MMNDILLFAVIFICTVVFGAILYARMLQILKKEKKQDDDLLEQLYWEFDNERNKGNRSERDIWKGKMRFYATKQQH